MCLQINLVTSLKCSIGLLNNRKGVKISSMDFILVLKLINHTDTEMEKCYQSTNTEILGFDPNHQDLMAI